LKLKKDEKKKARHTGSVLRGNNEKETKQQWKYRNQACQVETWR